MFFEKNKWGSSDTIVLIIKRRLPNICESYPWLLFLKEKEKKQTERYTSKRRFVWDMF